MHLHSRPVEDKDIPVICGYPQNERELFFMFPNASYPLTPIQLHKAVVCRSGSTVVELSGEVVAFANFYQWEIDGCCSIGNVIVSPAARGYGVGRYLIEEMIALACSKYRAIEVRISCFNENVIGLLLYAKIGFEPYALEGRQDKNGNRAVLIHMRLQPVGVGPVMHCGVHLQAVRHADNSAAHFPKVAHQAGQARGPAPTTPRHGTYN